MDALYPRILVTDFAASHRFWNTILEHYVAATAVRGNADGPYASWDHAQQTVFALFDRAAATAITETSDSASAGAGKNDGVVLVLRVDDVAEALSVAIAAGGTEAVPVKDRPDWGPTARTSHVRAPEGTLIEFQSY